MSNRARRFSFSWADEVEREEQEEQQQQQLEKPPQLEEKRERTKADPFGAARPREVVLAEKGVDWRDRDRELDDVSHRSANCRTRVQRKRDARAAPAPTTKPRQRHAGSTPMAHRKIDAPPVSCSGAWGGKRKCAGEAPARQVRPVTDQGRRVFGELNNGSCRNSSRWSSSKPPGAEGIEAGKIAAADGENRGGSTVPAMAGMEGDESGVGRKRIGKKRKRGGGGDRRGRRSSKLCSTRYHNCTD